MVFEDLERENSFSIGERICIDMHQSGLGLIDRTDKQAMLCTRGRCTEVQFYLEPGKKDFPAARLASRAPFNEN